MNPLPADATLRHRSAHVLWTWDLSADQATLVRDSGEKIWTGSLLPLFWIRTVNGNFCAVQATADVTASFQKDAGGRIALRLNGAGIGVLDWEKAEHGVRFTRMEIKWSIPVPALISLHWGAALLTPEQRCSAPTLEIPFWPNWQAEGFCVPSAKGAPIQSFFRFWDFGQATLPLGSFGPTLGTPYAAAYPRPVYAVAMGGPAGWVCLGAGSVIDGALCLQVRSGCGALEWLYREDLWGASTAATRAWEHPLELYWDETAWDAYRRYFGAFPQRTISRAHHQQSHWNSWGDFKEGNYELRSVVDRIVDEFGARVFCIDDGWESFVGSGKVHAERFPHFEKDLEYIRGRGLEIGFWQSVGWVADYQRAGLTRDDLLLNRDGEPIRQNWCGTPHGPPGNYCLDPSSPRTIAYLRERTRDIIQRYHPALIKVDFAYGLPSPHAAVPRDPALRGERMGWTLMEIVTSAAHEADPNVTIQGYSLHPLWDFNDLIALDDLGDAGGHDGEGHAQWSIWAALAGRRGVALCGSSGYLWECDADIVLNTAILGAPGAVLPRLMTGGVAVPEEFKARRRALAQWHRRTTQWRPLWLNSERGALGRDPVTRCWGRLEDFNGREDLTALVLRPVEGDALNDPWLEGVSWQGTWALVAQDDAPVWESGQLAVIPFGPGRLTFPFSSRFEIKQISPKSSTNVDSVKWSEGVLTVDFKKLTLSEAAGLLICKA